MPRKRHMSYEGEPKFRWVKMHQGIRYRVTCEELGAMVWTEEGSLKLANAWWEKKLAEIQPLSPVGRVIRAVDEVPIEKLREMMERGDAVKLLLEQLPFLKPVLDKAEVERVLGKQVQDGQEVEELGQIVGKVVEDPSIEVNRTFQHQAERFLAFVRGKPKTYKEIRDLVLSLYDAPGFSKGMDVGKLNEERVEEIYLWLKRSGLSETSKKKRWAIFKRLVRYLWEKNLIQLPRNLESKSMRFATTTKAVQTWKVEAVRACLKKLKPRMRLYALLGLNCGMTNADIGRLTKEMVDRKHGRLTRKRVKTASHDKVPTVDYPLWPETLALLKEHWSDHPELALTSETGTCLLETRLEGEEFKEKDLIGLQWQRTRPKPLIPIKAFRSISATLLESHASYGRYKTHFLGHSPKSIADKHYAAPSKELFDQIIEWLRGEVLTGR